MSSNPDCLFCKIVAGEIPSDRLYEDDDILVFLDINPQAPFHALFIPKIHLATLNDFGPEHAEMAGRFFLVAKSLAEKHDLPGYRVVVNTNPEGGQIIYHVHMHMLAGRQMRAGLG